MANADYDALVVAMQHGMGVTPDKAIACLQAISITDTMPMVRVPWNDPMQIQYVLDAGAYGLIVPPVNNAEDAAKAVVKVAASLAIAGRLALAGPDASGVIKLGARLHLGPSRREDGTP